MEKENLTMLTDFYELSMGNGYFLQGVGDRVCYFDVFYRRVPEGGGYVIAAGLDSFIDYIQDLHFSEDDLAFLKKKGMDDRFLDYLRHFKFECDVWAVPEGTPIFPNEPFMTVRGPAIQAQFIETMTLLLLNHQSLIATKANRIVRAAQGRAVMEFGSRRAHGASAAILGGRAAYIGGCVGTACTIDEPEYGVPALGTMAHSWIQLFDSEYEAFYKYAELYPNNCTLLVDTYDVLRSGVPNAIKVFDELKPAKKGIRIDSGDIAYLTKESRKMLDAAGHQDCKITVSNSLDEYLIRDILLQGAFIDSLGVGERMITSSAEPVLGGVYKLMAVEENGEIVPRIKISENVEKVTNPGYKRVWRLRDRTTGKDFADVITVHDEEAPSGEAYPIVDLISAKHFKKIGNFEARELLVPIFRGGELVYDRPSLTEIRKTCEENVNSVWEEVLRFENPHRYYVDLSLKLWHLRSSMLEEYDR
ncbi:MAG: nicotinate phosphoribosyltransferase [Firmicutes bacterium]|nr:nicotinate phosphoribosyltransferase [Bacillota bacterium]